MSASSSSPSEGAPAAASKGTPSPGRAVPPCAEGAAPKPPARAVEPRCPHFGTCGGCRLQDIHYEDQLARKQAELSELLARIGWVTTVPMHPSPQEWYYRNKMEFSFQDVYPAPAEGEDYLLLGQKIRNRWDRVMNIKECYLLSPEAPLLLAAVHAWALKEKLQPFNLHKRTGFLRHLVVREAKNTDERLVNLVTTPGKLDAAGFVKMVRAAYPATTVLWGTNSGKSDVAQAEKTEVLYGPGVIFESVLGKRLRVSPYSFLQTNTRGAEALYTRIRECIADARPQNLLDLYCGTGGITLSVADLCERVMGVELIESAIADARFNAEQNKVTNVDFMAAKVEDLLPGLAAQKVVDVDAVIVDPPRSGLHPTALAALKELAPAKLIYVSCNPKAMVEDIRKMSGLYDLRLAEGFDLFPHTDHMEALAVLGRIY